MNSFIVTLRTGERTCIKVMVSDHSSIAAKRKCERLHPTKPVMSVVEYSTHASSKRLKLPVRTMGDMGQIFCNN